MKTDTADRIITYLQKNKDVTPNQLREYLGIGGPAIFRQLKKLVENGSIAKVGKPPKVFYFIPSVPTEPSQTIQLDPALTKEIEKNFLYITPLGDIADGLKGFTTWCVKHNLPVLKTATEYHRTLKKYSAYSKNGLINGLPKFEATFPKVFLDKVYYLDFYSIERFGKTKLGSLLLHAKQSQSVELIKQLIDQVKPRIEELIKVNNITAVGFVPPTVQRRIQLQKELEKNLRLNLPMLKIVKATGVVRVAQKTLNKLPDRVENASQSIFVESVPNFQRILLLDDAIGSGASMNETARKIKEKSPQAWVVGLAITGSFKGFEVLNEV